MSAAVGQVFLVGCPRSGTTLLQRLLSTHPAIVSLPETHFLQRLLRDGDRRREAVAGGRWKRMHGMRHALQARLGWVPGRQALRAWAGMPELVSPIPAAQLGCSVAVHIRAFSVAMTALCAQAGAQLWLEKTPDHLFYLQAISRYLPQARVIHLLRDGEEVVASLQAAAARYPQWRRYADVERAIDRWNCAITESETWQGDQRHLHVRYERLVARPQQELARIFAFLGCQNVSCPTAEAASSDMAALVRSDEPWKQGAADAIADRRKFQQQFNEVQRERIRAGLRPLSAGLQAALRRNHQEQGEQPSCPT